MMWMKQLQVAVRPLTSDLLPLTTHQLKNSMPLSVQRLELAYKLKLLLITYQYYNLMILIF